MYQFGEWLVDPKTRRVSQGSQFVRLSPKAMGVLTALRDAGGVVSRSELLAQVWPDVTVGEEVLTHAIAEIRKAFGDGIRHPRYIETVHKSGYRLLNVLSSPRLSPDMLDLDAYAACLDGSEMFFSGGPQNVRLAAEAFSKILEAHPQHALAEAGLAKSLFFLDKYFGMPGDNGQRIERCGRRAVAGDQASPEAHTSLGLALSASGRYDEALASFATSLRLNMHLAETHYLLGRTCLAKGDYRLAATMLERAGELRADDFHSLMLAAKARRCLDDEARCRTNLIKARQRIDVRLQISPDDRRALCDKVCCMVELGEAAEAVDAASRVLHQADASHYYLVCGLARAGAADLALDCLTTVMGSGWRHGDWLAHDRDIDPLRGEPRFRRLAAEVPAP